MIFIIISVIMHFLFPIMDILDYPWNLLGGLPILVGIWLNLVADRAFKQANTTVKPFEESTRLLQNGVFKISRNPMYLGMVLILIGIAMIAGTLTPLIATFLFALLMDYRFIRIEEQMLQKSFGEEWQDYRQQVRRWI